MEAGVADPTDPQRITVTALAEPNEVGIDLSGGPAAAAGEIAGIVVDPQSKPIEGARVSFPSPIPQLNAPPVFTDAQGVFRIPASANKLSGHLQIERDGFAVRKLLDYPTAQGFTVHMDDRTRIKGQLLAADGSPAVHATLKLSTTKWTSRNRWMASVPHIMQMATADDQGRYDIPLEPGEYDVRIKADNGVAFFPHVLVPSGQEIALPDKLIAGVPLKIVAIDTVTHKPAAGIKCWLMEENEFTIASVENSLRTTDANGLAVWERQPTGPAQLDLQSDHYARWTTDAADRPQPIPDRGIDSVPVNVAEGTNPVTIHVEPGVRIPGTILSPIGKPVAGALVNVDGLETGDSRYQQKTDANGQYALLVPILPPEWRPQNTALQYMVIVTDPTHRWADGRGRPFTPAIGMERSEDLKLTLGSPTIEAPSWWPASPTTGPVQNSNR
jgi:hypothetical protein